MFHRSCSSNRILTSPDPFELSFFFLSARIFHYRASFTLFIHFFLPFSSLSSSRRIEGDGEISSRNFLCSNVDFSRRNDSNANSIRLTNS